MTFEEIEQAIAQMLAVQRELQETQIKQSAQFTDFAERLNEQAERHNQWHEAFQAELVTLVQKDVEIDRKLETLIGYSINRERDWLDVEQEILNLKRRITALEQERQNEQEDNGV